MRIISIREQPEYKDQAIKYFQQSWSTVWPVIYKDSIEHCINAKNELPQWYLLEKGSEIIACAGLITNDFISRGDLYPWICAIYVEDKHRGNAYASMLIDRAKKDAWTMGFDHLYLSTDHIGFYEKYGFEYVGEGYHPWEATSRIYQINLK